MKNSQDIKKFRCVCLKSTAALMSALIISVLSGCEISQIGSDYSNNSGNTSYDETIPVNASDENTTVVSDVITAEIPEYEEPETSITGNEISAGTVITLNGDSIDITGDKSGLSAEGSTLSVTKAGEYLISGTLTDGHIIVNTEDEDDVELIFNGVEISCSDGSPIYVVSAPKKAVITLAEGSVNIVSDSETYSSEETSAAIFSKDDLKINGSGTMYVTGNYDKGIFSKDDLKIEDAIIYVTAVDDGIRGKDSVEVSGNAYIYIDAGADGIRTSNETDEGKGYILIESGEIYITAGLDGIQAVTDLTVNSGTISILSGGGSKISSTSSSVDNGGWGNFGGRGGKGTQSSVSAEDTSSAKGLKAGGALTVNGGTVTVDSADDSLHSNDTVTVSDGNLSLTSGDDGIHADNTLTVSGGVTVVSKSYEGFEATDIIISGGVNRITSNDDGINGAGGNDGSSMNGRPGMGSFGGSSAIVSISGGYTVIDSAGDGLDSNGTVDMTGGTVIVFGPAGNGNGSIDFERSFNISGGTLLAAGSSGMAQAPNGEGQGVLQFNISMSAGNLLSICNSDESALIAFESEKSYQNIVFSSPDIKSGMTYSVYTGGSSTASPVDGIYEAGTVSGGDLKGTVSAK